MSRQQTKDRILKIAREILASDGLGAVSFDAIARRLGRTKQAVLYWYPTKHDLLAAMFLPWLKAEADVATRSVGDAAGRNEAMDAFVRAIAEFHFDDIDRFRAMYLLPQTIGPGANDTKNAELLAQIHPVTDRIYGALADHFEGDPTTARREAFAVHSAVLGLVLMFGLAENLNDPLKHSASEAVDALVAGFRSADAAKGR